MPQQKWEKQSKANIYSWENGLMVQMAKISVIYSVMQKKGFRNKTRWDDRYEEHGIEIHEKLLFLMSHEEVNRNNNLNPNGFKFIPENLPFQIYKAYC